MTKQDKILTPGFVSLSVSTFDSLLESKLKDTFESARKNVPCCGAHSFPLVRVLIPGKQVNMWVVILSTAAREDPGVLGPRVTSQISVYTITNYCLIRFFVVFLHAPYFN